MTVSARGGRVNPCPANRRTVALLLTPRLYLMFGSPGHQKRHSPHKPTGDQSPDTDDRYAPTTCIRLSMFDVEGKPVAVVLSPRAARTLAHEIFKALYRPADDGGA